MSLTLYFDTETSGLWRDKLPVDDPSQPHLLQLGAKLVSDTGRVEGSLVGLCKPEGWSIEPEAEKVHGISERRAHRFGIKPRRLLSVLQGWAELATRLVAHHAEFDRAVILAALLREGAKAEWWTMRGSAFECTMERATPLCRLPGQFGSFKFPSLDEAHSILVSPYVSRHDAEADVDACRRVDEAILQAARA